MHRLYRRVPAVLVCLLLAALLALSACGANDGAAPNEVDMRVAAFQQSSVSIKAGQSVRFVDPANGGGTHLLCVGTGTECVPRQDAPAELNTTSGLAFNPGDAAKDIVFANPGTYVVVCIIHPNMEVTVTVS